MTDREIREIRINSIVPAESVLVATARSIRPREAEEPAPRDVQTHVETCPFCRGNEDKTPPESAAKKLRDVILEEQSRDMIKPVRSF